MALSEDCSVDVLFNKLCASSSTVKCLKSAFSSLLVILYSCNFKTSIPIINDFVSDEPTLLKSTITFLSNKSSFNISSQVNIIPLIPLVNDSSLVNREPLYAPLLSVSNSLLSIISFILYATSTKDGYNISPYLFWECTKSQPQSWYDFSTALFNTAGIAAYIGQQTLNSSTSLSRCSNICIPAGKLNGLILSSGVSEGLVP